MTTLTHYPADHPHDALLVLAHGAGAGQHHPFMTATARGLAARGIDVFTFDFPYMQRKARVPDKADVLERAFREAIAEARGTGDLRRRRLFIGGKSMGGRMATHLGAQDVEDLRGIVVFGYPLHPPGRPQQLRTAHLPAIRVPLLIVQGERDTFGTPSELAPAIATMTARVTVHRVEGGDHSLAVRGARKDESFPSVLDVTAEWILSEGS